MKIQTHVQVIREREDRKERDIEERQKTKINPQKENEEITFQELHNTDIHLT